MSQLGGTINLAQNTPALARDYEQAGVLQFRHGKFLIGPLALKAGDHVLDIGAGTGRLTEFVASLVGPAGRVIGIDPLEHRIAIARLRHSATLTFETGPAEDLSRFDADAFDAVYLNSVLHWIADKPRTFREIHRLLKPGGRLGLNVQDLAQRAFCGGRLHRLPQLSAVSDRQADGRKQAPSAIFSSVSRKRSAMRLASPSPVCSNQSFSPKACGWNDTYASQSRASPTGDHSRPELLLA